ncbi:MAG: cupin domain-containing protein [Acidobacteriota bacterium]|nr:cupin domain-containing protein [Acidobacteriota bacterium]
MLDVININDGFAAFDDLFSPKIVADLNGQHVKIVRVEGDKVPWHTHDAEDELFWVMEGELEVLTRDGSVTLQPGEFTVVPHGVEHRILPRGHVKLVLFEPDGIAHTGKVKADITLETYERLGDL